MATSDPTATNLQDRVTSAIDQLEEVYQSLLHVDSLAAVLDGALGAVSDDNCHFQFHVRSMKKIAQQASETIDQTRISLGGSCAGGQAPTPVTAPRRPLGRLEKILDGLEEQMMVRIGRGIDSLNEFIDGQKEESPSLLLIRDTLADARNTCDDLFTQADRASADQPACEPEDDDPAGLLQSFLKRWEVLPQLKRAELVGIATRWAATSTSADTELDRRYADLTLPDVVGHVLYGYQNKLWQARGIVACALAAAAAEDAEDTVDIRYSLEAALEVMTPVIERLETGSLSRDAAKRELADAAADQHERKEAVPNG